MSIKIKLIFALSLFTQIRFLAQALPVYSVTVSTPQSTGYYFTTPIKVGAGSASVIPTQMILDNFGNLVYYKKFQVGGSSDFKLHANGIISYSSNNKFYLVDSTFTVVDSVVPKNGVLFDGHDMQILPNGNFLILGMEKVVMNLSSYNYFGPNNTNPGSNSATVTCGIIQELDAAKNVVFEWHCKDHYNFGDVDPVWLAGPANVDWTHLNAVEKDNDGNYLLSVRHFNEITKINKNTGAIIWRLGGNANQFTFTNDAQKFIGQHDIRRIANGNITLFDNGKLSPLHAAIAKEYQLNETTLTANLVWSYVENNNAFSRSLGNQQRLNNGNTLVNYGTLNNSDCVFNVVTNTGAKLFELAFADTLRSYRSFNYPTLPWQLNRPVINCYSFGGQTYLDAGSGSASYLWNTGATTQTILITGTGTYFVFVPKGQGGFISSSPFTIADLSTACITGINDNVFNSQFIEVFPSPATDVLKIRASGSKISLELFDLIGKCVKKEEYINQNAVLLPLSDLPSGVYLLKVNGIAKKIIKQ
jgi:hypothetical protein